MLTRRALMYGFGVGSVLQFFQRDRGTIAAQATEVRPYAWRHGLSVFGELRYARDFRHFDYVNPAAPKGGLARQGAAGTFDNFNLVVDGFKGDLVAGTELAFETLLMPSMDEADAEYGLLAEAVRVSPDSSSVTYRLRSNAQWHDGVPVTPVDVVFSFDVQKAHNPRASAYYRHVTKAEQTGPRDVRFSFDKKGDRQLPQIVGQFSVLPKHWWTGLDVSGGPRDVTQITLEIPPGSGPYRVKAFEPGRYVLYERAGDYWGRDLNVRIGCHNFDELRFDYFRDLTVEFEGFTANQSDWREENSSRSWATGYTFPAVTDGRVIREEFPIHNVGEMQAFAFNTRRQKFKDARVRRALNFALDFERLNRELFYGQYKRIGSYFDGTELASFGLPDEHELQFLSPLRGLISADVFTTAFWNPVGGTDDAMRSNLRQALSLLEAAGYVIDGETLVDRATRTPLVVEFLLVDRSYEGFVLFYKQALDRLGIGVSIKTVGEVEYIDRLRRRDFDIVVTAWRESLTPGDEQRDFWGSEAARVEGSRNLVGIEDPAIDALIGHVVGAADRKELVAATRALDRVLLWNHYVVPQWTYGKVRTARWDRFGRPNRMPVYGQAAFPDLWWWDTERAAATASRS